MRLLGPLPCNPTDADALRLRDATGLSLRQVRYWLVELRRREARRSEVPPFIELRSPAPTPSSPLRVVLPSGLAVEVPAHFDATHLRAVVGALC